MAGYLSDPSSEHWNTRTREAELVRRAFDGEITTDPCSNSESVVNAQYQYTVEDNGLEQMWWGNVFINPPFDSETIFAFLVKGLVEMRVHGTAEQMIYYLPAKLDQPWWHLLALQADAVATPKGRRGFSRAGRKNQSAPFSVVFLYFGPNIRKFERTFGPEGTVRRIDRNERLNALVKMYMLLRMSKSGVRDEEVLMETAKGALSSLYNAVKHLTVEEALEVIVPALQGTPEPSRPRAPKKKVQRKRHSQATGAPRGGGKERDERVAVMRKDVGAAVLELGSVPGGVSMTALDEHLTSYNPQQIRRTLKWLEEQGSVTSMGKTRNKTYLPASTSASESS